MTSRIVIGLIASIAATLVAIGMLTSLVPLHASAVGFAPVAIGWIGGCYYAGFLAGPWLAPILVARVGAGKAFALAAAVAMAAIVALPLLATPLAWAPLRFASGLGFSILYILVESGLNAQTGNETRGRLLSIYLVASKSALVAGQLLIGAIGISGWTPFVLAAAMVALAALISLASPHAPATVAISRLRPIRRYREAPIASFGCFVYGLAEGAMFALGPLFGKANGFDVAMVSTFMSAFLLGGAAAQWPLGALSDRIDRRRALLLGAGATIAAALMLGLPARPAFVLAVPGGFLLGAAMLPLYGLCVALANDRAASAERVEVGSWLMLCYAVGAAIGPPAAAMLMTHGPRALPLYLAGLFAILAAVITLSLRHPRRPQRAGVAEYIREPV